MSGAGSKLRKRAILKDVAAWVNYAVYADDHQNPYAVSDKRHAMFAKQLRQNLSIDADFREMNEIYGGDNSALVKRHYSKPTLRSLESFGGAPDLLIAPAVGLAEGDPA